MSKKLYIKPVIEPFEIDRLVILSGVSPESNKVGEGRFDGTSSGKYADYSQGIADKSLLTGSSPKY